MDIYREIAEKKAAGESFAVAMITKTMGSSPRDPGAKMIVYPDGSISGTIGGGYFEKMVISDCLDLFRGETKHLLKTYRFEESGPDSTGMSCGGTAEVFLEAHGQMDRLIIFGGGHIGRALARLAREMDFAITVVDDRQEILDDFHPPVQTILTDANYEKNFPLMGKDSYVVIVTHGHKGDQAVLGQVIEKDCAYIGMIGSKAKIAGVYKNLESAGFARELFEKVHAPIGLDIGSEGPYEIAISIIAEIIEIKRKYRRGG